MQNQPKTMFVNIYHNSQEVAEAFALFLFTWLQGRSRTTIALSGGSTPQALFRHLAEAYGGRIDWQQVHFFWGDERCVPPGHPDSNYGMTKKMLLDRIAIPETNVHRIRGEDDPSGEALRYGKLLHRQLPLRYGQPVFDLIILGMGDDGHTASIFPDQPQLLLAKTTCAVTRHPKSGQLRITLTGPAINNAENVAFLVTGGTKAEKVGAIFHRTSGWQGFPAAHVAPKEGNLYWFLDHAATEEMVKGDLQ